jgi:cobalt/nickel transport system permease protein
MENKTPSFLLSDETIDLKNDPFRKRRFSFLDRTISNSAKSLKTMYLQAESAGRKSLICNLNPVAKVFSFIYLIVVISIVSSVLSQLMIAFLIFILYLFSGIPVFRVYKKVLFVAFLFGFLVFAPAALNVITPGETFFNIISLEKPYDLWIYHIPAEIGLTSEGCNVVARLFFRVFNSVSLAMILAYTTPFPRIMKALRIFFIPNTFLMVVTLAYKFIYLLCRTIEDTYFALKSRLMVNVKSQTVNYIIAGRIFFIYSKAHFNYEQTWFSMISRGYEGKVILIADDKLKTLDFIILAGVAVVGTGLIFI